MKPAKQFISALAIGISVVVLAGCSKSGGDEKSGAADKTKPQNKAGVTIDAETQKRIGLKTEVPVTTQWQPEIKGFGMVIDPATLTAAVADLESARAAAEVSGKELERQKNLAAQDNASARTLGTAMAEATHDRLAFESALAKFKQNWGWTLAEGGGREKVQAEVVNGNAGLVRIDLPAGQMLSSAPASARIVSLMDEAKSVNGEFYNATDGVNPQTQSQSFFFLVKGHSLAPGAAVTGYLKISGAATGGVIVPASAVLRHEGKAWIYVQTGTNDFSRQEIATDRAADGGFFSTDFSPTNRIVVTGAQTVLSAEMGGGNFNSGQRD
ncbi:MAG TPA: hypothetical protein VGI63_05040 [Verrucomicrobiae bacterium]|jgi:hypothetical protein